MNPYGHFFGVPQPYYGGVPTQYQSMVPTGFIGYPQVGVPPPIVPVSQQSATQPPTTTEAPATQIVITSDKTPVTTVFVGNISERAPDSLIKSLLMRCGNILSWKRVQGASGKLQAFGFCEYQDPESTLRCMRLLNGFEIIEKKLMVKVDQKTEDLLNEYKKKKQKDGSEGNLGSTSSEIDDETKKDDDVVRTALLDILQETVDTLQLGRESPNRQEYLEGPRHLTLDDMDIDGERKDLINKEIETFRRRNENETPAEERGKRMKDLDYYSSRYASRTIARSEVDRSTASRYSRSRSRSREPSKKRPRGGVTSSTLVSDKHYRSAQVDEEEDAIKKRLERKLKEKEESYQARLRQWESRERKKVSEYEREKEREKKKEEEIQSEAQSLLEFFETYDDDVEDVKFYKGSALQRRLADREVEKAADERDRQKEVEQLNAARRKLIEEEAPDAESIILQMEQTMQEHLLKRLDLDAKSPRRYKRNQNRGRRDSSATKSTSRSVSREKSPDIIHSIDEPTKDATTAKASGFVDACLVENTATNGGFRSMSPNPEASENDTPSCTDGELTRKDSSTFLFSMASKQGDAKMKPAAAFADDDVDQKVKRPTLSWIPPSTGTGISGQSSLGHILPDPQTVANLPLAEKKTIIKQIIERIPTAKEELFDYPIDWRAVDSELVAKRIRPWVDKKIVTYLGEAEATLSNFICEQVLEHKPPAKILSDIALVLEEEAEVFVVKMWRLLIYVIAEKNLGLSV